MGVAHSGPCAPEGPYLTPSTTSTMAIVAFPSKRINKKWPSSPARFPSRRRRGHLTPPWPPSFLSADASRGGSGERSAAAPFHAVGSLLRRRRRKPHLLPARSAAQSTAPNSLGLFTGSPSSVVRRVCPMAQPCSASLTTLGVCCSAHRCHVKSFFFSTSLSGFV